MRWIQTFDQALAVARPAITVTLCISGGVLAGDLVGQAAMHAAGHVAGHVAADAAIATGITEAVVSTTGEGARQAAARLFRRLQTRFAQKRAQWLADFVEKQLLGDLLDELRQGAAVPESIEFRERGSRNGGTENVGRTESLTPRRREAVERKTNKPYSSSPPIPKSSSFLRSVVRCGPGGAGGQALPAGMLQGRLQQRRFDQAEQPLVKILDLRSGLPTGPGPRCG